MIITTKSLVAAITFKFNLTQKNRIMKKQFLFSVVLTGNTADTYVNAYNVWKDLIYSGKNLEATCFQGNASRIDNGQLHVAYGPAFCISGVISDIGEKNRLKEIFNQFMQKAKLEPKNAKLTLTDAEEVDF